VCISFKPEPKLPCRSPEATALNKNNSMKKDEFAIKNYLNKHNIYKDQSDMQTIIINSFYNQRGNDNDDEWEDKITYVQNHFGLFCQYAQNEWKQKKQ